VDRLQKIREDIIGLEQALEGSGSESEENELGVLGEWRTGICNRFLENEKELRQAACKFDHVISSDVP